MRRISKFLDIDIDNEFTNWDDIVQHCTFDWMKENGQKTVPLRGALWNGGHKTFINKGTNGRWKDILTSEEIEEYEKLAIEKLGKECAQWLMTGEGYPSD